MQIKENASLKSRNTFGIEAKAKFFAEYDSKEELKSLLQSNLIKTNNILHIGGGSNLLFLSDFQGVIIHSNIKKIEKTAESENDVLLKAGSGVVWDDLVAHCVKNQFYGVENLSLIPGEVGASAVQNIGAYGTEIKDVIESVNAMNIETGEEKTFSNPECMYEYRKSIFKAELKGKYIITDVIFRLKKNGDLNLSYKQLNEALQNETEITLEKIRKTVIAIRESKLPDPKIMGNAGSFFMNPVISNALYQKIRPSYPHLPHYTMSETEEKIPAGWLIEQCGFKGKSFGNCGVHKDQALVLVNYGNASGTEIKNMAELIQKTVFETFGINLKPEVIYV